MSTSKLDPRQVSIIRGTWKIKPEEVKLLDYFFLQHDTWHQLEADFYVDQQEVKRFLKHEGKEYEVILMQPVRQLQAAKELGLSFRVHADAGIRVVLIREWKEHVSNGKEVVNG